MSGTVVVVILLVAVGVLIGVGVAWPLTLRHDAGAAAGADEAARAAQRSDEVEEALERSLVAIREIELDHRTGNLSDEDFASLDRAERARAAELLHRRDGRTA